MPNKPKKKYSKWSKNLQEKKKLGNVIFDRHPRTEKYSLFKMNFSLIAHYSSSLLTIILSSSSCSSKSSKSSNSSLGYYTLCTCEITTMSDITSLTDDFSIVSSLSVDYYEPIIASLPHQVPLKTCFKRSLLFDTCVRK